MDPLAALGAGAAAGLALAVPLGAIGVLLLHEGASRGLRTGAVAALAVAVVDMLYALAAVSAGALLGPVISSWDPWPRLAGGVALLVLAVGNLVRARRPASSNTDAGAAAEPPRSASRATALRRFALFFALTAVNPATLVYFAAIAAGLPAVASSVTVAALFVTGIAVASLAWQLLLVAGGALARRCTGARFARLTSLVGNGVVAVMGVVLIAGSVRGPYW